MIYLLHGNDEFTCREHLKKLIQQGNFEFNQDTYSGGEVDLATITATCNTLPFLSDQRLVVVVGLPKRRRGEDGAETKQIPENSSKPKKGKKGSKNRAETRAGFEKSLAEYIPQLPETTVLIILADEELPSSSSLLKAAEEHGKVIQYTLPKGAAVENWINKRASSLGVKITSDAATMLANFIGNELRMLANELEKLATYVGPGATITEEDVRLLSTQVQEARIFDLTDALAQRNRKQALNILHDLLSDGEPPLKLISMITSQVRTLMLVKELAGEGLRVSQIVSATGMAQFVAEKALRQIGKFSPAQLQKAYHELLTTDAALKRSRLTPDMALDLLVVNFGKS